MRKRFCKWGHDTYVVGRDQNNWCMTCRRDSYRVKGMKIYPKRFCVNGHDTDICGRRANHKCIACDNMPKVKPVVLAEGTLPVVPLLAAFRARGISFVVAGSSLSRQLHRWKRLGYIPIMSADKIACEVLGMHPFEIWGNAWLDEREVA